MTNPLDYPEPITPPSNILPQTKNWYQHWWGVIVAIILWPLALIWYVWARKSWATIAKLGATAVIAIVVCAGLVALVFAQVPHKSSRIATPAVTIKNTSPPEIHKSPNPSSTTPTAAAPKTTPPTSASKTSSTTQPPSTNSTTNTSQQPSNNTPAPVLLNSYYPNLNVYTGYYLNGTNYGSPTATVTASPSVLWFQNDSAIAGGFYQYNSGPSQSAKTDKPSQAIDTCHWDQLAWTTSGLVYSETSDTCGTNDNQINYSPGIVFMPVDYSTAPAAQGGWQKSGNAPTTYTDKGVVTCQGTNSWTSKNMGLVTLTGNEQALWFQNNQTTTWTSGYDSTTGCGVVNGVDQVTTWQENFYLVQTLPVYGTATTAYALAREAGGNISNYQTNGHWDYDVWFNNWTPLP